MKRDISYTPFGNEAELAIDLNSAISKKMGSFPLKGKAGKLTDDETMMIVLKKNSETWDHVIPIQNSTFAYDISLFFGEGLHELEVLVPDGERDNYYQLGTSILIDDQIK